MEETAAHLRDGVLSHLEKLEAHVRELALKQEEAQRNQETVARLQAKVRELRLQRDELKTKVNLQCSGPLQLLGEEEATSSRVEPVQVAETSTQAVLEWKLENVMGMLQAFRLTGISGKLTNQGVCICLSTAYEGTYLDSYYLDLLLQQPVRIQRHSIPVFIPLEQIAKKYLQADIKCFLSVLLDHLNAYAGRKYQTEQLQEHFAAFLEGTVQKNSLYNLLTFSYSLDVDSTTFPFTAKLLYGDPACCHPTEVVVTCKGDASVEERGAHSAAFSKMPLHEAFVSLRSSADRLEKSV
uniref:Centromere protein O n=1 Tax=Sphenodon punctatus TaxID=8508 RepID=A0A8D0GDN9_SPHPU